MTLEFIEELYSIGHRVSLYCEFYEKEFVDNAFDFELTVITRSEDIDVLQYDVVYSHHQMPSRFILHQSKGWMHSRSRPVFIFNHLSPFEPFEFPGPFLEKQISDIVLCNSEETRNKMLEFDSFYDCSELFENPSPASFEVKTVESDAKLDSLLVVTNHAPSELDEALDVLVQQDIVVTRVGHPHESRRLMPADINANSAVVTIGKSVQYALRGKKPVYCYDHFGGPGWICEENMRDAGIYNFSGRSCNNSLSPQKLADDIHIGYAKAAKFASALDSNEIDSYKLELRMDRLLSDVFPKLAKIRGGSKHSTIFDDRNFIQQAMHEKRLYELVDRHYEGQLRYSIAYRKASQRVHNLLQSKS